MTPEAPESRYDLIYGRVRLALLQGLGIAGIIYEFFLADQVEPLILATAVTLAGIPVARIIDRVLQ